MDFMRSSDIANDSRVATVRMATSEYTMDGFEENNAGPGWIPQIIMEPMSTAITESPGMPNAIVVVTEPPNVVVVEVSPAMRPSSEPLPNSSFFLDMRRALSHPMMPEISPPTAGTRPMTEPVAAPMAVGLMSDWWFCGLATTGPFVQWA